MSAAASEAPRFMAVVVFPTPPFWLAMAMTFPMELTLQDFGLVFHVERNRCAFWIVPLVSKLAEIEARVLLPLGEGGPKGRMRAHFQPSPGASRHPLPKGEGHFRNRFPNRESHENRITPASGTNRIS